ncbi:MAG TPA: hypothetical protein DC017_16380 [Candidatus Wallbacteria bacterium]|nr:hypothetical protein [Candidatus Wallbacteria bacterium]
MHFSRTYRLDENKGFSLTELLIAIVIMCAAISPVFLAFSTSRKTVGAASNISRAVSFASTYMTALRGAEPAAFHELGETQDTAVPGALSPEKLMIDPVQAGFKRKLTLKKVNLSDFPGLGIYHAIVTVEWKNTAGAVSSYALEGLIDEKR